MEFSAKYQQQILEDFSTASSTSEEVSWNVGEDEEYYEEEGDEDMTMAFEALQPKTKKRMRIRRKAIVVPRFRKSDIRRYYAFMFCNSMNDDDCSRLRLFFRTFAISNLQQKKTFMEFDLRDMDSATNPPQAKEVMLEGIARIAFFWGTLNVLAPDRVVTVEDVQVVTRSDSDECVIHFDIHTSFTSLYPSCTVSFAERIAKEIKREDEEACAQHDSALLDDQSASTSRKRKREKDDDANLFNAFGLRKELSTLWPLPHTAGRTQRIHIMSKVSMFVQSDCKIRYIYFSPGAIYM